MACGQEPRGPGLAAEPLGSASPSLPARRRGDRARVCAAELGSRHHRPLGFSAGELTAPWTADCPLDSCLRGGLSARCKAHVLSSLWTALVAQKAMCKKLFEKYHYIHFKLVTFPVVLPHDHPHV